jgi:hypothetical protein
LQRQGQRDKKVEVIIPKTFGYSHGERWSYDQYKLDRLRFKRTLADACIDGVMPDGSMPSPAKIQAHFHELLNRDVVRKKKVA